MRILYLDVGGRYLNPTNSYLPAMLKLHHEVALFGPGLCCDAEIAAGLEAFVDKHGDFDFVISTQAHWEIGEAGCAWYDRFMYPQHSKDALIRFADEANAFMKRTAVRRIISLTNRDVYSITQAQIDEIQAVDGHYIAWARGFIKPQDDLDRFKDEKFYARRVGKKPFGLWYDLTESHHARFINFGHFIGLHEFDWRPLGGRSQAALVPGVAYVRRGEVKKQLRSAGLTRGSRWVNHLITAADRAGLRPYGRPLIHQIYNMRFVNEIANTRYAYTDGSGFDYPIRKFFEIPALGSLLLCTPCAGFSDLGFVDGKSAVAAGPEDVVDKITRLEREPEAAQAIADAGRQLMWDRHSIRARAEQMTRCLEAIRSRSFAGSIWRNGEFVVETSASAGARKAQSA
jgi:hypothetical protein